MKQSSFIFYYRTTQDHTLTGTSGSCSCTNSTTDFTSATVASLSITEPHNNWLVVH